MTESTPQHTPSHPQRRVSDPRDVEVTVEYGILGFYGMRRFAEQLHRDARAVSARMRAAARRRVRDEHGFASAYAGPVAGVQFLVLLVCGTAIIGVNGLASRFDRQHRPIVGDPEVISIIAASVIALTLAGVAVVIARTARSTVPSWR